MFKKALSNITDVTKWKNWDFNPDLLLQVHRCSLLPQLPGCWQHFLIGRRIQIDSCSCEGTSVRLTWCEPIEVYIYLLIFYFYSFLSIYLLIYSTGNIVKIL